MILSWILVAFVGVAHVQAGYEVTVWTSRDWWAGTDANVYIYLYGHKGTTSKTTLDKSWHNDFERGSVDTYKISSSDKGVVRAIKIGHDNRGWGPGWKLDKVRVKDTARGQSYYFNCYCWLEKSYREKTLTRKVDGGWSGFGSWGVCSKSCDQGVKRRYRRCDNPPSANGGRGCSGSNYQQTSCLLRQCPVNGGWTDYGGYSACSKSCGGGIQSSQRSCTKPKPQYGGAYCSGTSLRTRSCNLQPCPVDGRFGAWSDFTVCTRSCGGGVQARSRACIGPKYGGKQCIGPKSESRTCGTAPCPIDGKFGDWSDFTDCTVSCGGGTQTRSRDCIAPQHGGKPCDGPTTESKTCGIDPCPVHGTFTDWSDFTDCTVSCGGGTQTRSRECIAPQHGGKPCDGPTIDSRKCNNNKCPIDGKFGEWKEYGECSVKCGGGVQSRERSCDNPAPKHGGKNCEGPSTEDRPCNEQPCCATGGGIHACNGQSDGSYQSCDTCEKYIVCSGGSEHVMDCGIQDPATGARLLWNDESKTCDFVSPSCTQPLAVEEEAPEETEQEKLNPDEAQPDQGNSEEASSACLTGGGIHACDGQSDGSYQSCDTCEKYIVCSGGSEYVMDCGIQNPATGARLLWNDETKTCDFVSLTCTQPSAIEEETPEETEQDEANPDGAQQDKAKPEEVQQDEAKADEAQPEEAKPVEAPQDEAEAQAGRTRGRSSSKVYGIDPLIIYH